MNISVSHVWDTSCPSIPPLQTETDGREQEGAGDHEGAQCVDHRQAAAGRVAVMDVALARLGRAAAVGEILAEVLAEVAAPDQVAAEAAVGKGDDIERLVRQERERDDERLVALAAGDGALDQALAEEVEDPVVGGPGELHPGVGAEQALGLAQFGRPEVTAGEQTRGRRKRHSAASCRPAGAASRKKFRRERTVAAINAFGLSG